MIDQLGHNEHLVCVGATACRAPGGEPLPAVPQYIIVKGDVAPENAVTLHNSECLVLAGAEISGEERKSAEERYTEALAGRHKKRQRDGTPLYVKMDVEQINPKTKLSESEEETCNRIIGDMVDLYAAAQRKIKSQARQRGKPASPD